jgi:hypothetical protein
MGAFPKFARLAHLYALETDFKRHQDSGFLTAADLSQRIPPTFLSFEFDCCFGLAVQCPEFFGHVLRRVLSQSFCDLCCHRNQGHFHIVILIYT